MGTRLFVAGLAWRTTEEALIRHLATVGEVTWLRLVTDRETGRSKGFAFVEMGSPEQAERAVNELHGVSLDDRPLTVQEARPRPPFQPGAYDGPRRPPREAPADAGVHRRRW